MSRARHEAKEHKEEHKRAKGGALGGIGGVDDGKKTESYTAGDPDTEKEAERRKRGGGVHKGKMPTMVHGRMPHHHGNRPGRKRGGAMGADSHPMTEASKLEAPVGMSRRDGVDKEDD
jgi:hypothetical protein